MFPKKQRVPRESFKKIMTEGEKISSSLFLLRRKNVGLDIPRFAVVVSKKVEKSAVKRHFLKRRILNVVRDLINNEKIKFEDAEHIFILSKNIKGKNYQEVLKETERIFSTVSFNQNS